jgi:CelD/BcsL family acetyltransferase involved in cellulose biosynthesis
MNCVSVERIENLDQLEDLGAPYRRFVERVPEGLGIFYTPEWLRCVWPVYAATGAEWAWLLVRRGEELIGLAPLQIARKGWLKGRVRRLHPFGEHTGPLRHIDPNFVIPDPDDAEAVMGALRTFMLGPFVREWDLLDWPWMRRDRPATEAFGRVFPEATVTPSTVQEPHCDLREGFEAYWATRKRKFKKDCERAARRMEAQCERVDFDVTTAVSESRWEQVADLHRRRQSVLVERGEVRTSLFDSPLKFRAVRELVEWAERAGQGRSYWLDLDGQLASFVLGFAHQDRYFPFLMAHDETFAIHSPSTLLFRFLFQTESETQGTRWISPGMGMNLLKRRLATRIIPLVDVSLVNPTSGSARLRCAWLRLGQALRRRWAGC